MSVRVVHLLEMIEINKNDRKLVIVPLRAVDFRLQDEAHVPRVIQRGAVVLDGQLVNSLHVARILESDSGKVRERFQQFKSRGSKPSGPMQLINSITPRQVSRNFTGTATIDCVSVFVFSSTFPKNRVSFAVSGTTTVSPCCATQPAIPCPTLMRTSFSACEAFPTASSKYSSCVVSSSSSSDQLSGRRNSSIFSMMVRRT